MKNNIQQKILGLYSSRTSLAVKSREIAQLLNIRNNQEYQSLRTTLHQLVDSGTLEFDLNSGYKLHIPKGRVKGVLRILKNNYGVVTTNEKKGEILIAPQLLNTGLEGDTVEVVTYSKTTTLDNKQYPDGKIEKIIKRAEHIFIGTVAKTKNTIFAIIDNKKFKRDIYISAEYVLNARAGDRVVVEFIEWESEDFNPEGKIIEILGIAGNPFAEIKSILRTYNLTQEFPQNVEKEAAQFSNNFSQKEIDEREDCRSLDCVTIDPVDAKDFDDALSIEEIDSTTIELGVHIADVSYYVKPNSELDNEALARGTSLYLANQVVPMLPEKLSNNLCSLKPDTDRLAYSCFIKIQNGKIISDRIAKTIIHSKCRFTYEEVEKILDSKKGKFSNLLLTLWNVALKLKEERFKKGGINFETLEPKFKFDSRGIPIEIIIKQRLKSHQLVEECMLLANKLVALQIKKFHNNKSVVPFVFRIHPSPNPEKLEALSLFVSKLGFKFQQSKNIHREFQTLLENVVGKPEENIINVVTLRSMAKAIYDTENIGHFGLAFDDYTHFTSPIRRYPDLLVHRLLHHYLTKKNNKDEVQHLLYSNQELKEMCQHSSAREKLAQEAERDTIKIMQIEYMKNHIGKEFQGIISGVLNFGFFVELNETLVEGLIHARTLKDDYYEYSEAKYSLIGKRTGKMYRLGDKIKVKIISVNPETKKIDFNIMSDNKSPIKALHIKRKKR